MTNINLSPRETQVMFFLSRGLTENQISVKLKLSRATVSRVTRNIRRKCETFSITQAMYVVTTAGVLSEMTQNE